MSPSPDSTHQARPTPNRPEYGFLAWQATIGYISAEYSPDALLTILITPHTDGTLRWQATASWAQNAESIEDAPSLADALNALWREVDRHHTLFKSLEAAARKPVKYADDAWLDPETESSLARLIQSAQAAFGADWRLVLVYQPVETPAARVQTRLIARQESVNVGARGATLHEACRALYRHAAHDLTS